MAEPHRYSFLRQDSWSKPMGLGAVMDIAESRIKQGNGPFAITRDGEPKFDDLKRAEAIDKLRHSLNDAKLLVPFRVRNDKRSLFTARRVDPEPKIESERVEMVKWGRWAIAHAGAIHYSQNRPIPLYSPGHLPMTLDCSSSTILFARWSGINDLSKVGSSAYGNTATLMSKLRRKDRANAKIGDPVCWIGHTAYMLQDDPDPLLYSHGMESGPVAYRLSFAERYHIGTGQFYDLLS